MHVLLTGDPPDRFVRPKTPTDQFEITWYELSLVVEPRVIERRGLYHVDTPWKKLFPLDRHGADFTDQWQMFEDGDFMGRNTGWCALDWLFEGNPKPHWWTRRAAQEALRTFLQGEITRLQDQVKHLETKVKVLAQ